MAPRKVKRLSQKSEGSAEGQLSKKQRYEKKKLLFMKQFEEEAQGIIDENEAKLEALLTSVERIFRVEMLKMPPSLQCSLIKDLMSEDDLPAGDVTIAMKTESSEIHAPLTRKSSKKGNLNGSGPRLKRTLSVKDKKTSLEMPKQPTKSRSLAHPSTATKTPRVGATSTTTRTQGRIAKLSDGTLRSQSKTRTVNSAGPSSDFDVASDSRLMAATATILTSHGETMCLSDDVKDSIDVALLDDTAVCQMKQLMRLMDYLCNKVKDNSSI